MNWKLHSPLMQINPPTGLARLGFAGDGPPLRLTPEVTPALRCTGTLHADKAVRPNFRKIRTREYDSRIRKGTSLIETTALSPHRGVAVTRVADLLDDGLITRCLEALKWRGVGVSVIATGSRAVC